MKSLTRTIIVLVVFNLGMGSSALAQNTRDQRIAEGASEPTALPRGRSPMSPKPTPTEPAPAPVLPEPATVAPVPPEPPAPSPYPMRARSTGQISSRKVLVIPDTDVKPEELDAVTQDLLVMSHILDERFKGSRTIKGMFTDFGDFFGRDNRYTEAIYMQGYGVVFLMEVNFAFSPPLISEEQKDEETAEDVDPTWQRARQQIFSPRTPRPGFSEQGPGLVKFDQLKKELIETLKHSANIRNLKPDERIIVTVIGQGRQSGVMYFSNEPLGAAAPRSNYSSSYSESEQSSSSEGGGYAASRSSGVASGGMGGYGGGMMGGMGGYGRGMMGGYGGGMMGGMDGHGEMMGGMGRMGGMAGMGMGMGVMYGEMGFPTAKILTIRAKKSDVDAFAKGKLDFEQFQQMVEIFTY